MAEPLLSTKLLRQLEQFELPARRRSAASARGERRSRARGESIEFADHRPYAPGDDLRHLDWNLYGRLDRLFVKLHEEERELPVQVLLDASGSMDFGTPSKFDLAKRIAGAVGYIGLCGFDRVSVRVFPDSPEGGEGGDGEGARRTALRGVRGKRSAVGFLANLAGLQPGGAADFNAALRRVALEVRRPGVAVVVSDFLDAGGYREGLEALVGRRFHVNAVQILSPEELEPGVFGDLRVVDAETGASEEVTFGRYRMKAYRAVVDAHVRGLREYCLGRGIGFYQARSDAVLETLLLKEFRLQGMVA